MKKINKLVNEHWAYIEALLKAHGETEDTIKKIEYHYKTAFAHGWKHHKQKIKNDISNHKNTNTNFNLFKSSRQKQGL